MAVRVMQDVPGVLGVGRLWRGLLVLVGAALLVAGLIGAAVPIIIVPVFAYTLATGGESPDLAANEVRDLVLWSLAAIVAIWLGMVLIRGRRRLGLYLRKFGFADTTRTVSHALSSAIGRSLRLVTLDDSMVASMGAGRGRRRVAALVWLAAAAGIAWLAYYTLGGGIDRAFDSFYEEASAGTEGDLAAGIGAVFGAAIITALFLVLLLFLAGLAIAVALLGGGSYLAARRAERSASTTMTSERGVEAAARKLAAAGRRIFAARLVVVAVPTAFWQKAVRALAGVADVVIIDISEPTENLIWEVRTVKPIFGDRWVLVGALDRVAPLAQPLSLPPGTLHAQLAQLLDGEEILAYGPSNPDRRRFARALRNRLRRLPRRAT